VPLPTTTPLLITSAAVLAAGADDLTQSGFLQYGAFGSMLIGLAWWVKKRIDDGDANYRRSLEEVEKRALRFEDDNRRLYQMMGEQMFPALGKATDVMAAAMSIMAEIKNRDDIARAVEKSRRRDDTDGN